MTVLNWAGNVRFTPEELTQPTTVAELQAVVRATPKVRALGTGHSFNRIADTDGTLVTLRRLPPVIEIDTTARLVRIGAGVRYGELAVALQASGLALPTMGSLPHISVAGACATGTHGSGSTNKLLGASVRSLSLVHGGGELVSVDRDDADFDGCVLALGRLGIVTELDLEVVPTYDLAQTVITDVPDDVVGDRLVEILDAAYSVSVFTTWSPDGNRVWLKERTGAVSAVPNDLWGGRRAEVAHNPVPGMPGSSATAQLGQSGPWHERLPHFRLDFAPSRGEELQSEYVVPRSGATTAYHALSDLAGVIRPILLTAEFRSIAADPMWLSPTGGKDCVAFHFTWRPEPDQVSPVLQKIESVLLPLEARPHWAKVFTLAPENLADRYPRLAEFRALVGRHDPDGVFGNDLVDGWIAERERS